MKRNPDGPRAHVYHPRKPDIHVDGQEEPGREAQGV